MLIILKNMGFSFGLILLRFCIILYYDFQHNGIMIFNILWIKNNINIYMWNRAYNHCWIINIKYDYDWNYTRRIIRCWNRLNLFQISDILSTKSQRDNTVYNNNIEIKNNKITLVFCEKYISIEYKIFLFLWDIFEKLMNNLWKMMLKTNASKKVVA